MGSLIVVNFDDRSFGDFSTILLLHIDVSFFVGMGKNSSGKNMNLGENATDLVYEAISLDAGTRAYLYAESLDKYTPGSFHHTQRRKKHRLG